jgi:hypothetical protein
MASPDQVEGRLHRAANKSIFSRFGRFFTKFLRIFMALLVAPWRFEYKSDNFEEIISVGPFILWYDIVTEWVLFVRQRDPKDHVFVMDIPCSIMNILYNLGQFKFKLALGYTFVFLLDTFADVISRGHWQFGHPRIHYDDTEGWSIRRHPELRWRFNILGFNVGKGGIYQNRKCWSCDRRDFLRQNYRGDGCLTKSHECDHCFALNDEQYGKQLELTPRMRYDLGMYHGVTWLEALIRFEIVERLQRRFGSKKAAHPRQA